MDFFRSGKKRAESKGFDETDFVCRKDLSNDKSAWTKAKFIESGSFNKDAAKRETVIGVMVEEGDVTALLTGLIEGWQEKIAKYEKSEMELKSRIDKYERFLKRTERGTNRFLKLCVNEAESSKLAKRLKKIASSIKTILET